MESMGNIRVFLGWCTAINLGLLVLTTIIMVAAGKGIAGWHASMFGLDAEVVLREYFTYLANFKILFLIFNFAPYLALRIMA